MVNLSDDKVFLKVRDALLACEKIILKLNFFPRKDLVFKAGSSVHDPRDRVSRNSENKEYHVSL